MKATEWAIRRPVATAMVFLAAALLGAISLGRLSVDLLPELDYPRLGVVAEFPGVAPEEMEALVALPLESCLSRVPGLRGLESRSAEGVSILTLEFDWGKDMDLALLHAREELDDGKEGLPPGVREPFIVPLDPGSRPVLILAATGTSGPRELRDVCDRLIKPRLEQCPGVGAADVAGGEVREILVEIDPGRLDLYGIPVDEVVRRIDGANKDMEGGTVRRGPLRCALRVAGEFERPEEILDTPLRTSGAGTVVRISDVARVLDSARERQGSARVDGKDCVGLFVRKAAGANTISVTRAVKRTLGEVRRELPELDIRLISEQGRLIEEAVAAAADDVVEGAVLAFLVLLLFLREIRTPLIIGLVFPVSVISTFSLLHLCGITLNVMSLGGLALGVGMLDDGAVVVSESIARHRGLGKSAKEAAEAGAREVGPAVTAGALTTVVVFIPVIYVRGLAGPLFRDAALTASFSVVMSLLVSLTLLPMLESRSKGRKRGRLLGFRRIRRPPEEAVLEPAAGAAYIRALRFCLERRPAVLAVVGGIVLLAVLGVSRIPRELLPGLGSRSFEVVVNPPVTFSQFETAAVVSSLEAWLAVQPGTRMTFSRIGLSDGPWAPTSDASVSSARVLVEAADPDSARHLRERLGSMFKAHAGVSFTFERTGEEPVRALARSGGDIDLRVRGDDLDALARAARRLAVRLGTIPGIVGVAADLREGKPEVVVRVRDDVPSRFPGLAPSSIGERLSDAVRGRTASTRFHDLDRSSAIRVRLGNTAEAGLEALLDGYLPYGKALLPLRDLVVWEVVRGPRAVSRSDRQREVAVTASVRGTSPGRLALKVREAAGSVALPPGTRIVPGREDEERARSMKGLVLAFALAVLLNFMILAAEFESLLHPIIVLATVPFGLCGSVLAMLLTGASFNVISVIGLVVLLGIVVDNAIVEIDLANRLRRGGTALREAVLEAGRVRLRPVLISSATTLAALVPLSLGMGRGAALLRPLGIVLLGGLGVSTILTLFVVPVLYEGAESLRSRAGRRAG